MAAEDATNHVTKYRTDEEFRIRNFTLYVELIDDTWLFDVALNSIKRQAIIDAIFTSTRSEADSGYENAFRKQVENIPEGNMVRVSDTTLQVFIDIYSGYALPMFGSEVVSATTIPANLVSSAMDVISQIGPSTTDGTQIPSLRIQARTMSLSGSFFGSFGSRF